jgi:sarcosine oxidase
MTTTTADILVAGLGAVGSAALYQAAKLGARALGIDRFHPPHDIGSSHGETRITRQAIGEGREYVPLALRSNQIWEEIEAATGRSLLTRNGALILQSPRTKGDHHGSASFLGDTIAAAQENNIAHEVLSTSQIRERFPQFRVENDEAGYFEPGAGFLRPEACIETQLALARKLGAEVRTGETVTNVQPSGNSVEVATDRTTYSAGHAILTAGPWISKLLPNTIARNLRVYRQVMTWFALARKPDLYTPQRFPVFIWITGNRPSDMFYGFPAIDGSANGVKTATERYDTAVDPDQVERNVSDDEIASLHTNYIATRLPDVSPRCVRSATCLYTVAPGARFVIDQTDDAGRILFATACSGHGFKHSAAVGEALVRRALKLPDVVNLAPFSASHLPCGRSQT